MRAERPLFRRLSPAAAGVLVFWLAGCGPVKEDYSKGRIPPDLRAEIDRVHRTPIDDVDLSAVADGAYIGNFIYDGFTYTVRVNVGGRAIKSIDVLQNEDEMHPRMAEAVLDRVVERQKVAVDARTGATTTSRALLKAVEDALTRRMPRAARRPSIPHYAGVEALNKDHARALALAPETAGILKELIIRYYTCKAFQEGNPSACRRVDSWAAQAPRPGHPPRPRCRRLYYEGMTLKAALISGASQTACLKFAKLDRDPEEDEPGAEYEDCGDLIRFIRRADPAGFCKLEESTAEEDICRRSFAYLAADPDKCALAGSERAACEEKARLLQAVKEDKPGITAATLYAPLLNRDARACEPLAREVLEHYAEHRTETAGPDKAIK